jgi:hypothetical protein
MGVNGKSLIEIVSISVLAGGLILVAYQINQATNIADAEIRAEGTSRWRAVDGTRQGEMFAAALAKSYEDPAALTLRVIFHKGHSPILEMPTPKSGGNNIESYW